MADPTQTSPMQRLLNALALLASVVGRETIAEYLRMAAVVAGTAADDKAQFEALTAEVQAMVDAGRDPTAEEMDAVRARRTQLEAQIAAVPAGGDAAVVTVNAPAPAGGQ